MVGWRRQWWWTEEPGVGAGGPDIPSAAQESSHHQHQVSQYNFTMPFLSSYSIVGYMFLQNHLNTESLIHLFF